MVSVTDTSVDVHGALNGSLKSLLEGDAVKALTLANQALASLSSFPTPTAEILRAKAHHRRAQALLALEDPVEAVREYRSALVSPALANALPVPQRSALGAAAALTLGHLPPFWLASLWARRVAEAERPGRFSARDGRFLKPVRTLQAAAGGELEPLDRPSLHAALKQAFVADAGLAEEGRRLLVEGWLASGESRGGREMRAGVAFFRAVAYLAAGRGGSAEVAVEDAVHALVYGRQLAEQGVQALEADEDDASSVASSRAEEEEELGEADEEEVPSVASCSDSEAAESASSQGNEGETTPRGAEANRASPETRLVSASSAASSRALVAPAATLPDEGAAWVEGAAPVVRAARASAWAAASALAAAALERQGRNVEAAYCAARAEEAYAEEEEEEDEEEEAEDAETKTDREIDEPQHAALSTSAPFLACRACVSAQLERLSRRVPEPCAAAMARARASRSSLSAAIEGVLKARFVAGIPEFRRQRPKYYYYYEWMRKRLDEHCPRLPEPVVDKFLTLEAGELDLVLQYPAAARRLADLLQGVLQRDGAPALEVFPVPLLSWKQVQELKAPALEGAAPRGMLTDRPSSPAPEREGGEKKSVRFAEEEAVDGAEVAAAEAERPPSSLVEDLD